MKSMCRNFGRTGVKVSPLCLGCMMFGRKTEPEASYDIIDRAIDNGIYFLDTKNIYGRGISEEVTGEALKRNEKRDRVFLATKVHGTMSDDDPNALPFLRSELRVTSLSLNATSLSGRRPIWAGRAPKYQESVLVAERLAATGKRSATKIRCMRYSGLTIWAPL